MVTLSQSCTPFFRVTLLPTTAPVSMNTQSQTLQSRPTFAPARMWALAQTRVPSPTSRDSTMERGWMNTPGRLPWSHRLSLSCPLRPPFRFRGLLVGPLNL